MQLRCLLSNYCILQKKYVNRVKDYLRKKIKLEPAIIIIIIFLIKERPFVLNTVLLQLYLYGLRELVETNMVVK